MLDNATNSSLSTQIPNFVEEVDLQKYGLILKRRWRLITIIALSTLVLSGINALRQTKVYQSSGQLLIRSDQTSQLTGIDARSGDVKSLTAKTDPLTTEIEILKSNRVLQNVVAAIKEKRKNRTIGQSSNPDGDGKTFSEKEAKIYDEMDIKEIVKGLTVKPVVGTDILQINYQSKSPDLSAAVVNEVMEDYIRNNIEVNRSQAVSAKQFILAQLPEIESAVRKSENNLKDFREANGIVSLTQEAEESVRNLSALTQNINTAQSTLAQSQARVTQLRSVVGMDVKTALTVNALNQSSNVQKTFADWRLAQAELGKQQALYKDNAPEISLLKDQVQVAKADLDRQIQAIAGDDTNISLDTLQLSKTQQDLVADLARAEVDRATASQGIASLIQSRAESIKRSSTVPRLETAQRELQRQVDAAQTTYKTLLTKLQEVQVAENQTVGNARIISNAEIPEKPSSNSITLMLISGGFVGLLLGIASAFTVDYTDKDIRTIKEIKKLLPYPLLGVIPSVPGKEIEKPEIIGQNQNFGAQEAYQMLQANLRFSPSDQTIKSILVTSALAKEGKSTVAANLALALAQGQRRVLLVDADLRHGDQHHIWGINNVVGLSNLVVEQVQMTAAIQTITQNLHVLTTGSTPPNPLALLDSSMMKRLIEQFTDRYDFVVFDGPTLLGTADSTVLNRITDGSLLVVRMGHSSAPLLKAAKQFIEQSSQHMLGVVVNGAIVYGNNDRDLDSYFYTKESPEYYSTKLLTRLK